MNIIVKILFGLVVTVVAMLAMYNLTAETAEERAAQVNELTNGRLPETTNRK